MYENNPLWAEVEQRVYHRSELPALLMLGRTEAGIP